MVLTLPPDFVAFLSLLNKNRVAYLLVGGYAVGIHGYVRATNDIDVWIEATEDNGARAEAAIREFGFDVPELSVDRLLRPGMIVRMGLPPMRVEVLNSISGVTFAEAHANRIEVVSGDIVIPVIGLQELLANKRAFGRSKDLGDIEGLSQEA